MKTKKLIAPLSIFMAALLVFTGIGGGTWFFGNMTGTNISYEQSSTTNVDDNDEDNVIIDDIAENYYFASDMKESNYYDVYFFPSPKATDFISGYAQTPNYESVTVTSEEFERDGTLHYSTNPITASSFGTYRTEQFEVNLDGDGTVGTKGSTVTKTFVLNEDDADYEVTGVTGPTDGKIIYKNGFYYKTTGIDTVLNAVSLTDSTTLNDVKITISSSYYAYDDYTLVYSSTPVTWTTETGGGPNKQTTTYTAYWYAENYEETTYGGGGYGGGGYGGGQQMTRYDYTRFCLTTDGKIYYSDATTYDSSSSPNYTSYTSSQSYSVSSVTVGSNPYDISSSSSDYSLSFSNNTITLKSNSSTTTTTSLTGSITKYWVTFDKGSSVEFDASNDYKTTIDGVEYTYDPVSGNVNYAGKEKYTVNTYSNNLTYTDGDGDGIYEAVDSNAITHYYQPSAADGKKFYYYTTTMTYKDDTYKDPVSWYNAKDPNKSNSYGFWGIVNTSNKDKADLGSSDDSDKCAYGYKHLHVYKQVSTSDYAGLGNLACMNYGNHNPGWYPYFNGFTADLNMAITNATRLTSGDFNYPHGPLFDLTKSLKEYDALDGKVDRKVYLYAIYSFGKDYYLNTKTEYQDTDTYETTVANTAIPAVHLLKDGDEDAVNVFQWIPIPSDNYNGTAWNGTSDLPFYYTFSSVRITNSTSDTSQTAFNLNDTYYLQITNWNGWETAFDISTIMEGSTVDAQNDTFYNVYFYANTSKKIPEGIQSIMDAKNIVYQSGISSSTHKGYYCALFIEAIYCYNLTGDLSTSFDYSVGKTKNNLMVTQESTPDDNHTEYYVYESPEITVPSLAYDEFCINYGSHYSEDIAKFDSTYAPATNAALTTPNPTDPNAVLQDDGTQYTNPKGDSVYYNTSGDYFDLSHGITYISGDNTGNDNAQRLPTIKLKDPGVYKFRFRVKYTNGKPSEIYVSCGYLRGLFVEIFVDNPTSFITGTGFVNHEQYLYRSDCAYDKNGDIITNPTITLDTVFYSQKDGSGNRTRKKLSEIIAETHTGKDAILWDHVTKDKIIIDPSQTGGAFSTNFGKSWSSSMKIDKNYIFFFHTTTSA